MCLSVPLSRIFPITGQTRPWSPWLRSRYKVRHLSDQGPVCLFKPAHWRFEINAGPKFLQRYHWTYAENPGYPADVCGPWPASGIFSAQFARMLGDQGLPLIGVQHHHAHADALSCMAEITWPARCLPEYTHRKQVFRWVNGIDYFLWSTMFAPWLNYPWLKKSLAAPSQLRLMWGETTQRDPTQSLKPERKSCARSKENPSVGCVLSVWRKFFGIKKRLKPPQGRRQSLLGRLFFKFMCQHRNDLYLLYLKPNVWYFLKSAFPVLFFIIINRDVP